MNRRTLARAICGTAAISHSTLQSAIVSGFITIPSTSKTSPDAGSPEAGSWEAEHHIVMGAGTLCAKSGKLTVL